MNSLKDQQLILIALFAALIAALGLIPPVPFAFGLPITAQSLGIMLCGLLLGPWRGALAVALFLLVTTLGAPLLAGGRGGFAVWVSPTAGFLVGYLLAPLMIGWLFKRLRALPILPAALLSSVLGGILFLHLCGIIGFSLVTGRTLLDATLVMWVFWPGDLIKAVLAALVVQSVYKALPHWRWHQVGSA